MSWDLRLDPQTRDMVPGIITGPAEIVQRLITRLQRELGEWFLDTEAGLPWYGDAGGTQSGGRGILGSKVQTKRAVDLLIRRETLGTDGVERIVKLNTLFPGGGRTYTIYMEVFITGAGVMPINMAGEY